MNVQVVDIGGAPITGAVVSLSSALMTVPVTIGAGANNIVAGLDVPLGPGGSIGYTREPVPGRQPAPRGGDGSRAADQRHQPADRSVRLHPRRRWVRHGDGVPGVAADDPHRRQPLRDVHRHGVRDDVASPLPATCVAPGEVLEIDGTPPLTVTATRIAVRTNPFDPAQCGLVSGPAATVVASADGSFEFFGEPGYYRVTVGHDDHETIPGEFITQQGLDLECQNPDIPQPFPLPPLPGGPQFGDQPVYQLRERPGPRAPRPVVPGAPAQQPHRERLRRHAAADARGADERCIGRRSRRSVAPTRWLAARWRRRA